MKQRAFALAILASVMAVSAPAFAAALKATPVHVKTVKPAAQSKHKQVTANKIALEASSMKAGKPAKGTADVVLADPLNPLSSADVAAYRNAFASGDMSKVGNSLLKGRVAYGALIRQRKPTFTQLTAWLKTYGDQAGADRIYQMALKARPRRARAPRAPTLVRVAGRAPGSDKAQAAREAYYSGDIGQALALALPAGEHWIAGLADYRLNHFEDARIQFAALAHEKGTEPWLRSAAAYWAGRASALAGSSKDIPAYLTLAAQNPQTFYGMIAERQLDLAGIEIPASDPIGDLIAKSASVGGPDHAAVARFVSSDARAHRAAALAQLGRMTDAGEELRAGLASAKTDTIRDSWMALTLVLNPQIEASQPVNLVASVARRINAAAYPVPELQPTGGFTLDPALVYALVRQESGFNPMAVSPVGAVGLMQLMPSTAAQAAGDDTLKTDTSPLFDPATNLRVGQDYFAWLMQRGLNDNDLLRGVAAYNGGPGLVGKALAQLGPDCDSLLLIETLPAQETRNYVERVTAAYWTYRRLFGVPSGTLDALASGARIADIRLDSRTADPYPAPPPSPLQTAEADAAGA